MQTKGDDRFLCFCALLLATLIFAPVRAISAKKAVLGLLPKQKLNTWESKCLDTHNRIRYAHNADAVKWNRMFGDMAKDWATKSLLKKKIGGQPASIRPPMTLFGPGDVTYESTDDVTTVPLQVLFKPELFPSFLADKVEKILYEWLMRGLFEAAAQTQPRPSEPAASEANSTELGNYKTMVDSAVAMIGCGLKVQVISSTRIKINFVVAYFHSKHQQVDTSTTATSIQQHHKLPQPYPGRSCQSHCDGSCCSLKFSADESEKIRCSCNKKFFLSKVPFCQGNCFIRCPNVANPKLRSCHGKSTCYCGFNRAVCT